MHACWQAQTRHSCSRRPISQGASTCGPNRGARYCSTFWWARYPLVTVHVLCSGCSLPVDNRLTVEEVSCHPHAAFNSKQQLHTALLSMRWTLSVASQTCCCRRPFIARTLPHAATSSYPSPWESTSGPPASVTGWALPCCIQRMRICHSLNDGAHSSEQHPARCFMLSHKHLTSLTGTAGLQRAIDVGYICSVCLSIFCEVSSCPCKPFIYRLCRASFPGSFRIA